MLKPFSFVLLAAFYAPIAALAQDDGLDLSGLLQDDDADTQGFDSVQSQNSEVAVTASAGVVRVLDKLTGDHVDLTLQSGEMGGLGFLQVTLNECRYPVDNPSGDAYISLVIRYRSDAEPVFSGWMIASSPALNAMDHQRYDVWALRCITS
ncbi:DUF2155 domain-containing protein [Loktanella sp. D2R18]|uniref:DUF2155 domain-containing protein n=1 Tax=Rhodobacterales TaxID=204455 RepID=UPI000DE8A1D0|nr:MULTISPECIES: DUF2155 domain-containing protein [Rhodobacterales]MDO6590291.1 DUF2155 domain-containing protein [Yoonia sp. 1_MG-2023]RBW42904.1 DUF2155 domain-containing protein [Loktanella sp. D2R18]